MIIITFKAFLTSFRFINTSFKNIFDFRGEKLLFHFLVYFQLYMPHEIIVDKKVYNNLEKCLYSIKNALEFLWWYVWKMLISETTLINKSEWSVILERQSQTICCKINAEKSFKSTSSSILLPYFSNGSSYYFLYHHITLTILQEIHYFK